MLLRSCVADVVLPVLSRQDCIPYNKQVVRHSTDGTREISPFVRDLDWHQRPAASSDSPADDFDILHEQYHFNELRCSFLRRLFSRIHVGVVCS